MQIPTKEYAIVYPLLFFISFIFILTHSVSTSPLYVGSHSDSTVFMLLGRFFIEGKIPYSEYFDHKGPMIIFIEAFAQQFNSDPRTSIFIFQVIVLFFCCHLIYRSGRLMLSPFTCINIVLLSLVYYTITFDSGNLTEEYSLPLLLVVFYYSLKNLLLPGFILQPKHYLLFGLCFSIVFWIRMNNVAVICACILFLLLLFVLGKQWRLLFRSALFFFIGFLCVTVPIIIYFYILDALPEMLYASFGFNFKYAHIAPMRDNDDPIGMFLLIRIAVCRYLPFVLALVGTILYYYKKEQNKKLVLFSIILIVVCAMASLIGLMSSHYMTITIPLVVYGLILIALCCGSVVSKTRYMILFFVLISSVFAALTVLKNNQSRGFNEEKEKKYTDALHMLEFIPKDERTKVYTYRTGIDFLYATKLYPYYKYFISQDRHGMVDPEIFTSINQMMQEIPPIWLVMEHEDDVNNLNPQFFQIRDRDYMPVHNNDTYRLYRHK